MDKVDKLKEALKFGCNFGVPSDGKSGGLAILWKEEINLQIRSFSMGHINTTIKEDNGWWRFIGFYGNPITNKRKDSWDLLEKLSGSSNLPWIIGGDFNEILLASEKLGGVDKSQAQMNLFREVVDSCNLHELGCGTG